MRSRESVQSPPGLTGRLAELLSDNRKLGWPLTLCVALGSLVSNSILHTTGHWPLGFRAGQPCFAQYNLILGSR